LGLISLIRFARSFGLKSHTEYFAQGLNHPLEAFCAQNSANEETVRTRCMRPDELSQPRGKPCISHFDRGTLSSKLLHVMSLEKNLINRTVEPHYIAYLTTDVNAKSSLYIRAYVYLSISQHEQLVLYKTQKLAATTCEHTHTHTHTHITLQLQLSSSSYQSSN
jgi:hypothetical protein